MSQFFPNIGKIGYEGPKSKNALSYKHYNPDEVVEGKTMRDHLRFSVVYWHTMCGQGADMFGGPTAIRPWDAGLSGIDLQRELQRTNLILPIIFITGHGDIPTTVKAMKAGAVDFLPKPVRDTELLRAIEQALARAIHDRAQLDEAKKIRSRVEKLTAREHEVMSLIIKGWLNKQIAFELGIGEKTIKVHRARVMEKMEVDSVAELVRLAERAETHKR